jgi:cytochrome c biogenesis protein CcdA
MTITFFLILIGIALSDSLNPSLFAVQAYLLTTPHPVKRVLSYIGGVLAVNFTGGLLVLGGVRTVVVDWLQSLTSTTIYSFVLLFGLVTLAFGWWVNAGSPAQSTTQQPRSLQPIHAFTLGAVVMLNEITTALPYFFAIERIAQAQQGVVTNVLLLVLYNLVFAAPLFALLAWFVAYRQRFAAQINRVISAVRTWTPRVLKYGAIVFGGLLVLHAGTYLLTGTPFFT